MQQILTGFPLRAYFEQVSIVRRETRVQIFNTRSDISLCVCDINTGNIPQASMNATERMH